MLRMAVATAWAGLAAVVVATLPENPANITVYHVNQPNYTGITNMNTADAAGDAVFDMRTLAEWMQCNNKSYKTYPSECDNPEQFATDLVITKVVVSVGDKFSRYGECNVCENSTVPFSHPPRHCTDGNYVCNCGFEGCAAEVGKTEVADIFKGWPNFMLPDGGPPAYWMINYVDRVGGIWYSTVDKGECDNPVSTSCQWKIVETVRKINATCQSNEVSKQIEKLGQGCFAHCQQPLAPHSNCYIDCYYQTLLGDGAGSKYPYPPSEGGLSGNDIVKIWTDAFEACPAL